jgi:succinyl-CoA synthetase beta subunit
MLEDYGVPTVAVRAAASIGEAHTAAGDLGYPVALKTATPGVRHKSEVGGVRLGIGDAAELEEAYRELEARLGPEVVVAPMAPGGVEVALGIVRDHQFGPLVVVAAGGVLVELLRDRRLAFPPLDERGAKELIGRLRIRPLLDGVRGRPAADIESLAHAISRLSVLASDLGDHLDGLDANPVIVSPRGCVAVDAVVVPRPRTT